MFTKLESYKAYLYILCVFKLKTLNFLEKYLGTYHVTCDLLLQNRRCLLLDNFVRDSELIFGFVLGDEGGFIVAIVFGDWGMRCIVVGFVGTGRPLIGGGGFGLPGKNWPKFWLGLGSWWAFWTKGHSPRMKIITIFIITMMADLKKVTYVSAWAPADCSVCFDARFSVQLSPDLDRTSKIPHKCSICPTSLAYLKKHFCDRTFSIKSKLKRHSVSVCRYLLLNRWTNQKMLQ